MLFRKSLFLFSIVFFVLIAFSSSAKDAEPPKNVLLFSTELEDIIDNGWSNLEFLDDEQPPGLYYVELTELVGTVGCWGSKKNPYENGTNGELLIAWRDGQPMEDNEENDFRLQYLSIKGDWVELIVIEHLGVINENWNPFGLQEAQESIGQTFIVPEEFIGVGLQTPTWASGNSGCTMTLYAAEEKMEAVQPGNKLAVQWGRVKLTAP